MPSTYSSLLRLELMAVGEKTNTWGVVNNTNLGTLLEKSIAGYTAIDVTSGDVVLTEVSGGDDQARSAILRIIGTPGTARNITAPSISKTYTVLNASNATVTLKGAATSGVAISTNESALVAWNGTDFARVGATVTTVVAGTVAQNPVDITTSKALVAGDFGTGVLRVNSSSVVAITVPTVAALGLAATAGRIRVVPFELYGTGIPTFAGLNSSTTINGTAGPSTAVPLGGTARRYQFLVLSQLAPGSDAWSLA